MSVRRLLIETSGRVGRVGVAAGDVLLAERALDANRRHARDLAPAVADLLAAQGWAARDLDVVAVSVGPGSYTGLRVGVIAAKALAYATGCAVVGVPTFAVLARQADLAVRRLDVIADALKGKLYVQSFARPSPAGPWTPAGVLHLTTRERWLAGLAPDVGVTGPGVPLVRPDLPDGTPVAPDDRLQPTVAALLAEAAAREPGRGLPALLALEPLYLRPSSAEEQWDALGRP